MVLEDFVMLGTTVPEPNSDGRVFVCSAGVSAELRRLVRIYPLARHNCPKRWQRCRIPAERNPKDSRDESWRIAGQRDPDNHPAINYRIIRDEGSVPREHRADLLAPFVIDSIAEANRRRISLAIIHPEACPQLDFKHNPQSPEAPQQKLFDDPAGSPVSGSKRFAFNPYLRFRDAKGEHNLQLRDWGTYEFLRKHDHERRHELTAALHLSAESSLLVGNFNAHRTSWCVISVLSRARRPEPLFDPEQLVGGSRTAPVTSGASA